MIVFERAGAFVASVVADDLRQNGVDCLGVTATEDADGNVVAVQIICGDETDEKIVDAAVAAYVAPAPESPPAPVVTPTEVAAQMAQTITTAVQSVPAGGTVDDLSSAIVNALAPYIPAA